jgi:hypothetical protein
MRHIGGRVFSVSHVVKVSLMPTPFSNRQSPFIRDPGTHHFCPESDQAFGEVFGFNEIQQRSSDVSPLH